MNYKTKTSLSSAIILTILSLTSCENGIDGSGETQIISPSIENFAAINISIPAKVYIDTQTESTLQISAQANILENTDIYVKDGTLMIKFDKKVDDHAPITIRINKNELSAIDFSGSGSVDIISNYNTKNMSVNISGGCNFTIRDTLWCEHFKYNVSGSASLNGKAIIMAEDFEANISGSEVMTISDLSCKSFIYKVSGSGKTNITGHCNSQYLTTSGYCEHNNINFMSKTTSINISGSGDLEVLVTELLKTNVSGSANIKYKGDAKLETKNSDSVTIIHQN